MIAVRPERRSCSLSRAPWYLKVARLYSCFSLSSYHCLPLLSTLQSSPSQERRCASLNRTTARVLLPANSRRRYFLLPKRALSLHLSSDGLDLLTIVTERSRKKHRPVSHILIQKCRKYILNNAHDSRPYVLIKRFTITNTSHGPLMAPG